MLFLLKNAAWAAPPSKAAEEGQGNRGFAAKRQDLRIPEYSRPAMAGIPERRPFSRKGKQGGRVQPDILPGRRVCSVPQGTEGTDLLITALTACAAF